MVLDDPISPHHNSCKCSVSTFPFKRKCVYLPLSEKIAYSTRPHKKLKLHAVDCPISLLKTDALCLKVHRTTAHSHRSNMPLFPAFTKKNVDSYPNDC